MGPQPRSRSSARRPPIVCEGGRWRATDLDELARIARVLPSPSGVTVDVVLAGPGLEEAFLERAREVVLAGYACPSPAPSGLDPSLVRGSCMTPMCDPADRR